MNKIYMLDTNICSFIMRQKPESILHKLQESVLQNYQITISAITYAEMKFGSIGKKASPKHAQLVEDFCVRIDAILPWDRLAVDVTTQLKIDLAKNGTPIGDNDVAIAGHAVSCNAVLVTNNVREFQRIKNLSIEDWSR